MRTLVATIVVLCATAVCAADWTPDKWADESTLELRTSAPDGAAHWFPVWLVVLDDQLYVRLGPRAAGRVEQNGGGPFLGVRVGGQEFERIVATPAPDARTRVA